jgi:hypothetical protein
MGKHLERVEITQTMVQKRACGKYFAELVTKVNPLWSLLRPAHHVSVSSGCLPSEYLVADEAPAHSLRYDENLANRVFAEGRSAIFLSVHMNFLRCWDP